jgi:hypothetical protein
MNIRSGYSGRIHYVKSYLPRLPHNPPFPNERQVTLWRGSVPLSDALSISIVVLLPLRPFQPKRMAALTVHRAFLNDILSRQSSRRALIDPTHTFRSQPTANHHVPILEETAQPSKANVVNYVSGEETIRNDYAARYGASGEFGSNHILGAGDHEICEEYVCYTFPSELH